MHSHDGLEWDIDINQPMFTKDYLKKIRAENEAAFQHEYDNPKGSGPTHALSNSDQCVNTRARLETGGFLGDTTADLDYTMKIEGFCANNEAFVVVP